MLKNRLEKPPLPKKTLLFPKISFKPTSSETRQSDLSNISTNSNLSNNLELNFPYKAKSSRTKSAVNERKLSSRSSSFWDKPPIVTSKCYALYSITKKNLILGKKEHQIREIASLTKIMTCLITLNISNDLNLDIKKFQIRVSKYANTMIGTSARLKEGDILTINDLLFGLMLPSGNDAGFCLGESLGTLIYLNIYNKTRFFEILQNGYFSINEENNNIKDPIKYFLAEMNEFAKINELKNTHFANTTGLANKNNHSSAFDIAKLCAVALNNKEFEQICNTKIYECNIKNNKTGIIRKENWTNTNKLLQKGYNGVKTGVTDTAGPCLATSFKTKNKKEWIVCVILGCKHMEKRWLECEELIKWGLNNDDGIL